MGTWELGWQGLASGYHLLFPAKEPWAFTLTLEAPGNRKMVFTSGDSPKTHWERRQIYSLRKRVSLRGERAESQTLSFCTPILLGFQFTRGSGDNMASPPRPPGVYELEAQAGF